MVVAVTLIERAGTAPHDRNVPLKCGNDNAGTAANYAIGGNVAMRQALRLWQYTCKRCRSYVSFIYIETKVNRIEDAQIRAEWDNAMAYIEQAGRKKEHFEIGDIYSG